MLNQNNKLVSILLFAGLMTLAACGGDKDQMKPPADGANIESPQGVSLSEGSAGQNGAPSEVFRKVEGSESDIDGHPQVDPNEKEVSREVIVPPDVEGKWQAVKIMVRHKLDEEKSKMHRVELGSSFTIDGAPLKVTVGPFMPNFVMDRATYTSGGNELSNPAVRLVVKEGDKTLFEGWAFAKFPGMYAFEHETYSLQLMDFIPVSTS